MIEDAGEKWVRQFMQEFFKQIDHHVRSAIAEIYFLTAAKGQSDTKQGDRRQTGSQSIPIELLLDPHHFLEVAG